MTETPSAKQQILLIDDEPALLMFTRLNLELSGRYSVDTAAWGLEGVEKAQATAYDLVITDYKMPGMDGVAVIKVLKTLRPKVPIVLFSIYHDDDKVVNDIYHQVEGIISKPIDHAQLYQTIEDLLARAD